MQIAKLSLFLPPFSLLFFRFFHWTVDQFHSLFNPRNCDIVTLELQPDHRYKIRTCRESGCLGKAIFTSRAAVSLHHHSWPSACWRHVSATRIAAFCRRRLLAESDHLGRRCRKARGAVGCVCPGRPAPCLCAGGRVYAQDDRLLLAKAHSSEDTPALVFFSFPCLLALKSNSRLCRNVTMNVCSLGL